MGVPVYKVPSFEIVEHNLLRRIAQTGKPVILSTGMATRTEIQEALDVVHSEGLKQVALLKCTSAYPAPFEEMNLKTIPDLAESFGVVSGLSDHSSGIVAPIVAAALGASVIEKHLILDKAVQGPDSHFSIDPKQFSEMVEAVRAG